MKANKTEELPPSEIAELASVLARNISLVSKPQETEVFFNVFRERTKNIYGFYADLIKAVKTLKHMTHEVEHILDNFYILEGAVEDILNSFTEKEIRKLPQIEDDGFGLRPRLYVMFNELLKLTENRIGREDLEEFIVSYQNQAPLSIRELNMIPTVLRMVLVDSAEILIKQSINSFKELQDAEYWFNEIMARAKTGKPADLAGITLRLTARYGIIPVNFGFYLYERLRESGTLVRPIIRWLQLNFSKQGIDIKDLPEIENRRRGKTSILMSNIIDSLRWLNQARWDEFARELNTVDKLLMKDPGQAYELMDSPSRNLYWKAVVQIADRTGIYEEEVVKLALSLARVRVSDENFLRNHVGYYLVDAGRAELEAKLNYRPFFIEKLYRLALDFPSQFYIGGLALVTASTASLFMFLLHSFGADMPLTLWLMVPVLIASSEIAVNLMNVVLTNILPVKVLPKLDFTRGVVESSRTFVVIPSVFRSIESVNRLVGRLEILYLTGPAKNIFFSLLMDLKDASAAHMPDDDIFIAAATAGISRLNKKYPLAGEQIFHLFARRRSWNPREKRFMGWERKRGMLNEFNSALRGRGNERNGTVLAESISGVPSVKYVVTIDEDTEITRDAIQKLIGCISHPLNRAVMSENNNRVLRGFGIIQPRIVIRQNAASKSIFGKLFATSVGIDSYSGPVADVYQDLFGSGIFFGKGIYEVDIFERSMIGQIPENAILSHDLIEGIYARVGFATDIQFFDGFPQSYTEYSSRLHRWTRGDWQALRWLGNKYGKKLSFFDKWKIFDNLRRSLAPMSFLLLILSSFWLAGPLPLAINLFALIALAMPFIISAPISFLKPPHYSLFDKVMSFIRQSFLSLFQIFVRSALLLYQGLTLGNAVLKSLIRVFLTRNRLLEWRSSADVSALVKGGLNEFIGAMWLSSVIGMIIVASLRDSSVFALSWGVLWAASPLIAYWLSSKRDTEYPLAARDIRFLRQTAYRSSRFFIDLVSEANNWLIPDHFQDEPRKSGFPERVTTSPTNLGCSLGSLFSARDFGYFGLKSCVFRLRKSVSSIKKLSRFKGHLYNWYDVRLMAPVSPKYISSVDSANFIVSLIVLKNGLEKMKEDPIFGSRNVNGFVDVAEALTEEIVLLKKNRSSKKYQKDIDALLREISAMQRDIGLLAGSEFDPGSVMELADHVGSCIASSEARIKSFLEQDPVLFKSVISFANELYRLSGELNGDINSFLSDDLRQIPTLLELSAGNLSEASINAKKLIGEIDIVISDCRALIEEADFGFLYNKERGLFHIGYNETFNKIDNSYYDFLASEASLISFVAISKGQVPSKHWFYLGRKTVRAGGGVALSSWGGSLFEYLTANLYLDAPRDSLLDGTSRVAIKAHRDYARKNNIPWGMGESAYNILDINQTYQYQIFGVPALGLKRGLKDFLVVAPYTSVMSLMWDTRAAVRNLMRLRRTGVWGGFGFYDSIDYTASVKTGAPGVPVRIYYAHHQGFALVALNNVLNQNRFRRLFHADPMVASSEALLEEGVPTVFPPRSVQKAVELSDDYPASEELSPEIKRYMPFKTPAPRYSFISNGRYNVCVSNAGSGYSKNKEIFLTRFKDDPVLETWGQFVYIRDRGRDLVWSPTLEPTGGHSVKDKVVFLENSAEFLKIHNDIESLLKIAVSADDVEIREINLTNLSAEGKTLEVSSYGEPVMTRIADDRHHPGYHKMLIESEFMEDLDALIFSRPDPSDRGGKIYFAHFMVSERDGSRVTSVRRREDFLGRHGSVSQPAIFTESHDRAAGPIPTHNIDPIFSLRKEAFIKPGGSVKLFFLNAVARDKQELLRVIKKYRNWKIASRAIESSRLAGSQELRKLGLTSKQAFAFQDLASQILAGGGAKGMKDAPKVGRTWIESLWRYGISGDLPILILRVKDIEDMPIVRHMILLHKYLKHKGLDVDVVFLNEYSMSYIKTLDDEIDFLIRYHHPLQGAAREGGIFHLKADLMDSFDREVIMFVSHAVFESKAGTLEHQISSQFKSLRRHLPKKFVPKSRPGPDKVLPVARPGNLSLFNGIGGFDVVKKEYVMFLSSKQKTPVPWVNIIANPNFGFIMTESGSTFSWSEDSYDNRLTSWYNDILLNRSSEIFYLRDEETGEVWNPTPLPIKSKYEYKAVHGLGYSRFEHARRGLRQEFSVYVPISDKIKIFSLKIINDGSTTRRLSITGFFEMVLGVNREHTKRFLKFARDAESGGLLVNNSFRNHFNDNVVFLDMMSGNFKISTDRDEFLGRHGSVESPDALKRESLSDEVRYGYDNCAALQSFFELAPGEEKEIVILLGEGNTVSEARALIGRYRNYAQRAGAQEEVRKFWDGVNGSLKLESPDESLNIIFNDWAGYQLVSSRIFARTGYYQPSGAYGFRDQLQDSMALVLSSPKILRDMIIRAAAHQFKEGDSENWWHDHNGYGIRVAASDQQLWLPYVTGFYIEKTGDLSILEEMVPFLEAPVTNFDDQPEWTGIPAVSAEKYSIYEHCIRAIDKTSVFGKNRLPLIGRGDWNDGFNLVGASGKGESVWLGLFLITVIKSFLPLIEARADMEKSAAYNAVLRALVASVESRGWDGKWYRRAYFDSGIPLGSAWNADCQIDSIAQSWAVFADLGDEARVRLAMKSALDMLWTNGRMKLLTPPFTKDDPDPGYVRDNPPGVRENGGQYNHAALWMIQALTMLGEGDKAMEIIRSLNPVMNSSAADSVLRYRVEPYVLASDIYTEDSYPGRGGWTWYTGSAGLFYRTILEYVLGIKVSGDILKIDPCFPKDWKVCGASYRFGSSLYSIKIENPDGFNKGVSLLALDGKTVGQDGIKLIDDGRNHEITVILGA